MFTVVVLVNGVKTHMENTNRNALSMTSHWPINE